MSPKYPNRNTSNVYTGPSVPDMIAGHTLGKEIIARHNDECPILDDDELALLQKFVADPSKAQSILAEREGSAEGSLVAYALSKHKTDKPALTDDEIVALRAWFESGDARTD